MKKVLLLAIVFIMLFTFCSCGNMSYFGKYTFTHIYIETYKTEGHCYEVEKWVDSDSGIEVKTKEMGQIFVSEGNYILFESAENCPYCHAGE